MDINNSISSNGAYKTSTINNFNRMYSLTDENEIDTLNDETFGDCDLTKIKIKSDFGDNGEFLGDDCSNDLPEFFDTDINRQTSIIDDTNDQSQSIDALLGEDPMRVSLRQTAHIPLFNMAISQARNENIFAPHPAVQQQQQQQTHAQINLQLLRQLEQLLINQQVPPQERGIYLQRMIDRIQQQQQLPPPPPSQQLPPQPISNLNRNGYPPQPPIGGLLEQARLASMGTPTSGISSQFLDAIQRSDQLPAQPTLPSVELMSNHRANRSTRHYPRPPMLNTWQNRGPKHDEFAGMMSDREKQWVVKIQLHQVAQTQDEDFYFQTWSQQKHRTTSTNRHDHRAQKITYPVLQLLKSIQQEKELADRLSQTSAQINYTNVNPLPYALPIQSQLGKQSTATPKHPRCTIYLDGQFALGTRVNSITHDKYNLGILLHLENIFRDILSIENQTNNQTNEFIQMIIQQYFHDEKYFFPDLFGSFRKGQIIFERLVRYLITNLPDQLDLMFIQLYSSLSYMIRRYSTTFTIEISVMNTINLLQQQISANKSTFEQILIEIYRNYNEQIKAKILQFDSTASSSPFSDPNLFTNSHIITILIDLLFSLERQCYLLSHTTSNTSKHQHQQQQQSEYQLSEYIRLFISDICLALINCSSTKKLLKPFAQIHQQQFNLLCKFLRTQMPQEIYTTFEPKLISCCIKDQ